MYLIKFNIFNKLVNFSKIFEYATYKKVLAKNFKENSIYAKFNIFNVVKIQNIDLNKDLIFKNNEILITLRHPKLFELYENLSNRRIRLLNKNLYILTSVLKKNQKNKNPKNIIIWKLIKEKYFDIFKIKDMSLTFYIDYYFYFEFPF
ncbi:hypothetical protein (nucleomorph) [Guillardia theta]|uniref:Uncharacterized protein n=1 Tax=Guillardia theta TaxID=55529 RepID=Q98RR4_GUITH|nr:hypothetical protein GTHECHR1090 [Guillardia theta]AAK39883.1 hypothetical protein [Guillardia theta]